MGKRNVCWESALSGQWAKRVTRSSAEQLTGNSPVGACDANDIVGSWLSFPLEGKCVGNVTVGDNGCTWKQTGNKVILMDCMKSFNSSGWARAWQEDFQKAPFPNVMAHVKAAVRECPDVRESARRLRGARQNWADFQVALCRTVALAMWKCIVYEWFPHIKSIPRHLTVVSGSLVSAVRLQESGGGANGPYKAPTKRQVVVGALHHGAQDTLN